MAEEINNIDASGTEADCNGYRSEASQESHRKIEFQQRQKQTKIREGRSTGIRDMEPKKRGTPQGSRTLT